MSRLLYIGIILSLICWAGTGQALDEIWLQMGTEEPGDKAAITVATGGSYDATEPVPFVCNIDSEANFQNVDVQFIVLDAGDQPVARASQTMNLAEGPNRCVFYYEAEALEPGDYSALIEVIYDGEGHAALYHAPFARVTSANMLTRLDTAAAQITTLRERGAFANDAAPGSVLAVRLNIATDFLARAKADGARGDWRAAARSLHWIENALRELRAQMAFGSSGTEMKPLASAPLASIDVNDGALRAGGKPVFLFGRAIDADPAGELTMLRRYGLNLAELAITPKDSLSGKNMTAPFEAKFDPAFAAAESANIAVAVSLNPDELGGWAYDVWPGLDDKGFVDLVHEGVRMATSQHLAAVGPYLAGRPMIAAVSIAEEPAFKFDSTAVHRAFINHIKERYPDRQELNRLWRAHLASHEDITIWGKYIDGRPDPVIADHHYQNRRAYQADWQLFHRDLVTQYFESAQARFREYAPSLPLTVTLTDSVFLTGETRGGVDREALAQLFDLTGAVATTNPADSLYALSYPRQAAFYTLMRSLQPEKPVFTMEMNIVLDDDLSPAARAAYVESVLWEGVTSGMSAAALPADSPVFETPETIEAFARAAADINRLAPVIVALQRAPTDVGILFSAASKILDDGVPHLSSAWDAYEGASFSGYNVRFITEEQCQAGALNQLKMLIIPETPAVSDATFAALEAYVDGGGSVARVGTPIPYNEHGYSRTEVLRNTGTTIFVRGLNLPTEYLHAMDAASEFETLPYIPRAINQHGFPLEGMKTRYVEVDGEPYLYAINLRKEPLECHLTGILHTGRDLIDGTDVEFPAILQPLDPMLIRLDKTVHEVTLAAGDAELDL